MAYIKDIYDGNYLEYSSYVIKERAILLNETQAIDIHPSCLQKRANGIDDDVHRRSLKLIVVARINLFALEKAV